MEVVGGGGGGGETLAHTKSLSRTRTRMHTRTHTHGGEQASEQASASRELARRKVVCVWGGEERVSECLPQRAHTHELPGGGGIFSQVRTHHFAVQFH